MRRAPDIAVLHDYFGIRGGGERVALALAEGLAAELVYGYRLPQSFDPEMFPPACRDLALLPALRLPGLRALALAPLFARQRAGLMPYRNRLYSGIASPFAAPDPAGNARNLYYCHTPPRFLYDLAAHYRAQRPLALALAGPALDRYRRGYEQALARMDVVIANSANVAARLKRFLGREAAIIHPPCDTARYRWREAEGYYLSTARLTPLKRIETIIDAFLQLPSQRLVVASDGESGPRLRARAGNAPNIAFTGALDDPAMRALIGGAIATLYVPRDEDFGLSPVESMAAGKPVIGVGEGGLLETVLPGETGLLLSPGFDAAELAAAVRALTPARAAAMRHAAEARAGLFALPRFTAAIAAQLLP